MNQEEEIHQARQEQLARGEAFQLLMQQKGWELVMSYYMNQIKAFTTDIFNSEELIDEFENRRQQLIGIRKLLASVEHDAKEFEDEITKPTQPTE